MGLIPNPIRIVLFLILSLLVSIFQSFLLVSLSVSFQWLTVDDYVVNTKAMIHTLKFVVGYMLFYIQLVWFYLLPLFFFIYFGLTYNSLPATEIELSILSSIPPLKLQRTQHIYITIFRYKVIQ
jgi:hypothetical protein